MPAKPALPVQPDARAIKRAGVAAVFGRRVGAHCLLEFRLQQRRKFVPPRLAFATSFQCSPQLRLILNFLGKLRIRINFRVRERLGRRRERRLEALLRRLRDPRWEVILAVSPDHEGLKSRIWPKDLARIPQGPGDLGDRMGRILRSLPPGPVAIIGADIPGIDRPRIARAFAALGRDARS